MRLHFFAFMLLMVTALPATARPISYPGGWTIMQMNEAFSHSLHLYYSPSSTYSLGYNGEYFRDKAWQFHGVQLNNLLHRWNNPDSQANLYLKSGLGIAYSDYGDFDNKSTTAAFTGMAIDWENRRFFTSYENKGMTAGTISRNFSQQARIGVAPYIGNYGDLHSWLMLQLDHAPSSDTTWTVTPLIRLFKGTNLMEAGISSNGTALFNITHNF